MSQLRKKRLFDKTLWNCHGLVRENLLEPKNICKAYPRKLENFNQLRSSFFVEFS